MYRKGTIILPVLIVLIIIFLSLAAVSFYLYQKEHAQNLQLQDKITELEQRQRITENKLEEAKKAASELTLKLQEASSKVESLTGELTKEKSALTEASNKLEQFNADIQQQKSLRQDLEDRLKTATEEGKKINEQMKIIQQQKTELENKIKNMEDGSGGVELGKVVVGGEPVIIDNTAKGKAKEINDKIKAAELKQAKTGKPIQNSALNILEGKIMIVNKEFNFAVINLGSKDKVIVGDEFTISRDGRNISELKVEKVHESMSAAGFAPEFKDLIRENDKVTQKIK
ncbi:MAG: hypothetical protein PHC29_01030 [Candidatus Omnitrophica bacterium]|nr:hypothetical protein [Candidatus Omnitrophota bacterium]